MNGDRSQYIKLFKEEAGEYLDRLEEIVVKMEKDPTNDEIITEAFRIFHTLKGMAASLGYKEIESISHDLEERLEEIKKYGKGVDKGIIDRIFEEIDRLEYLVGKIGEEDREGLGKRIQEGNPLFIKITLKKDIELPGARAAVIIKRIEEREEIEEIKPSFEEIKGGEMGDTFWVRCANAEGVREMLSTMDGIEEIRIEGEEKEKRVSKGGVGGIRVNVELLDYLQNVVGELVVSSSQLSVLLKDIEEEQNKRILEAHNSSLKELQNIVTRIRLVPLSLIFNKFPRYVRDLSKELGREVSLDIYGSDIEVDRSLLEGISDPLIHLIRNAVSHGIEPPLVREKAGKVATGRITVSAKRAKGDILIEISDDGKGIDEEEVLLTALEKGWVREGEVDTLTKKELLRLLFLPGFTTLNTVSEVSGRGVGLDVVNDIVRSVGGSVNIKTEKNKGTTISMKMPLSMSIIRVYLIESKGQLFALPMTFVDETIMIPEVTISQLMGKEIMLLRREILPVYRFSDIMKDYSNDKKSKAILPCVIVEIENERFALIVDNFKGSSDAVVKPLPLPLNTIKEYTGITIIGDGKPCLILDLPSFRYRRRYENRGA